MSAPLGTHEHQETRIYQVRHRTEYNYEKPVTGSYGRTHLTPRDLPSQTCSASELEVSPTPNIISEHVDHFGNVSHYVEVHSPHQELVITATNTVTVRRIIPDLGLLDRWTVAEAVAALGELPDRVDAAAFTLPSRKVPRSLSVSAYAEETLSPDRPLGAALLLLVHTIYSDFKYKSGVTSVNTTLDDLLRKRVGVCQDFAHLMIGCLRSVGLPARYVSGYLETQPPPGKPRLQGADASHAWVSVLTPDLGWIDLDPTNNKQPDSRFIIAAWGRDFSDVTPMKGVIFTQGKSSTLDVGVDVTRLDQAPQDQALPGMSGSDL